MLRDNRQLSFAVRFDTELIENDQYLVEAELIEIHHYLVEEKLAALFCCQVNTELIEIDHYLVQEVRSSRLISTLLRDDWCFAALLSG